MAKKMKEELNHKFQEFGIVFESCAVTGVHANETLTKSLQDKSKLKYEL
jgi:membrane protease subunit (stomatin/prohibitin family)